MNTTRRSFFKSALGLFAAVGVPAVALDVAEKWIVPVYVKIWSGKYTGDGRRVGVIRGVGMKPTQVFIWKH